MKSILIETGVPNNSKKIKASLKLKSQKFIYRIK